MKPKKPAAKKILLKMLFSEISQNSQESTYDGDVFRKVADFGFLSLM